MKDMTPLQALNHVISLGRRALNKVDDVFSTTEEDETAVNIVQLLTNTAIPLARFRVFIKVISVGGALPRRGKPTMMEPCEFTICAPDIKGVKMALEGLRRRNCQVYVGVFEQLKEKANFITGYEGPSRNGQFKQFVVDLEKNHA